MTVIIRYIRNIYERYNVAMFSYISYYTLLQYFTMTLHMIYPKITDTKGKKH